MIPRIAIGVAWAIAASACRSDGEADDGVCGATPAATEADDAQPTCCGCLCVDPSWSCSQDTCVGADGKVRELASEAGFLEIGSHSFVAGETQYVAPTMRMWYAFRPAREPTPETPLVVLFNGGPFAGSGILFGANTHDLTADPQRADPIASTERPWTTFAHLLYIDQPHAGFSYGLLPRDEIYSSEHDASTFLHVILAFLERHPRLAAQPIVLVGESWGGLRATLMLEQMHEPDALLAETSQYQDAMLHGQVVAHEQALQSSCSEGGDASELEDQFSRMVSIQGALGGLGALTAEDRPGCIEGEEDRDVHFCDRPEGWSHQILSEMLVQLRDPESLSTLLGVDVTTIEWMYASAREGAIPRGEDQYDVDEAAMAAAFGELPGAQRYYLGLANGVPGVDGTVGPIHPWEGPTQRFIEVARWADVFLTDARLDTVIDSSQLPDLFASTGYVLDATVDREPRDGVARPGWLHLRYDDPSAPSGVAQRTLRFPAYDAGHMITLDQPVELADDLREWLAEP